MASSWKIRVDFTILRSYFLFPEGFVVPVGRKSHSLSVHIGVLYEKRFEFLLEGVVGIYGVELINHHRQDIVNAVI